MSPYSPRKLTRYLKIALVFSALQELAHITRFRLITAGLWVFKTQLLAFTGQSVSSVGHAFRDLLFLSPRNTALLGLLTIGCIANRTLDAKARTLFGE